MDVTQGLHQMMSGVLFLLVLCCASVVNGQNTALRHNVLERLAKSEHRLNLAVATARIRTGINVDRAYRDLDTMLAREYGDMFWMYSLAGFYHSNKALLSESTKAKIREAWKLRTPYRGDTENHFLMYYGSLFLMSEVWPELPGSEWFTGRSSREINVEAKEYLLHWIDQVAKYGLNEFDSPRYQYYFLTPVILLAEYAQDPLVRSRSELLLELLLADYAVKYVEGNYAGAHSRTFEAAALTADVGEVRAYGDYFFEDSVEHLQPDIAFVASTDYQCPEIIKRIARQKSYPFELFESKRQRPSIRYVDSEAPVPKYTYITDRYSLGSISLGLVQPIQQQSWKLTFHDSTSPNTITGLHPYISARELATYFPEEPSFQAERIESTKAGYSSENKWVGGSPYQEIVQNKGAIEVHARIPQGVKAQHIDIFLPRSVAWEQPVEEGMKLVKDQWYRFLHNGIELAIRFANSEFNVSHEHSGIRLRSELPNAGYAIVVNEGASKERFGAELDSRTRSRNGDPARWQRKRKAIMKRAQQQLYVSPYINSRRGSGIITLTHGKLKRTLNFRTALPLPR